MSEEIRELKEQAEAAKEDRGLFPVTMSMATLAVRVTIVTLWGHEAHIEEPLLQNQATSHWAYFQAKSIRRHRYEQFLDLLSVSPPADAVAGEKLKEKYSAEVERNNDETKEIEGEARKLGAEVAMQGRKAARCGLGVVLLEVALVVSSMTPLTRKREYWFLGLLLAAAGLVVTGKGLFIC